MSEYRKIEDIIREKKGYIADYDAKIAAWEAVTIKKKKDGTEFAALTKACIDGASIGDKTYTSGKELTVYYFNANRPYNYDSIDCFGYCDELPDGDERKVHNGGLMRTKYMLTPSEMRERIEHRIALYKGYKAETEAALSWLEVNADSIDAKMRAFRDDIFDGAPDDIGIRHAFGDIVCDGIKYGFR